MTSGASFGRGISLVVGGVLGLSVVFVLPWLLGGGQTDPVPQLASLLWLVRALFLPIGLGFIGFGAWEIICAIQEQKPEASLGQWEKTEWKVNGDDVTTTVHYRSKANRLKTDVIRATPEPRDRKPSRVQDKRAE